MTDAHTLAGIYSSPSPAGEMWLQMEQLLCAAWLLSYLYGGCWWVEERTTSQWGSIWRYLTTNLLWLGYKRSPTGDLVSISPPQSWGSAGEDFPLGLECHLRKLLEVESPHLIAEWVYILGYPWESSSCWDKWLHILSFWKLRNSWVSCVVTNPFDILNL